MANPAQLNSVLVMKNTEYFLSVLRRQFPLDLFYFSVYAFNHLFNVEFDLHADQPSSLSGLQKVVNVFPEYFDPFNVGFSEFPFLSYG